MFGLNRPREVNNSISFEVQFNKLHSAIISGFFTVFWAESALLFDEIKTFFTIALEFYTCKILSDLSWSYESF